MGSGVQEASGALWQSDEIARLIKRARDRDRTAFAEIYRLTITPVYRYLSVRVSTTQEAEDLTQEVFLAALAGIQGLRAQDEPALLAWLFQIARHKVADHLRRRYRRPSEPLGEADDVEDGEPRPDELAEAGEERAVLRRALAELTDEQREVIVCKYVLDYDNGRTARVVGKNANAVNQLHHRAIASLQRLLRSEKVK